MASFVGAADRRHSGNISNPNDNNKSTYLATVNNGKQVRNLNYKDGNSTKKRKRSAFPESANLSKSELR